MRTCKLALVVLALVMVSPLAVAQEQEKPDINAAKTAFKAGQEFMQMHRYADAVVEFTKAFEITKDGLVMGQVAEAYAKGGDYEAALKSIKLYHAALPEGERAPAEQLIAEYEKAVKEGRSQKLVLPNEKPAVEETTYEGVTPPTEEEETGPKKRLWTWIAAGTTGALFVGALVVGLNAQSSFDDAASATGGCKPYCSESTISSIESKATTADVLWGLTAAAAVTTGVIYWLEGRSTSGTEENKPYGTDEEEEEEEAEEEEEDMVQRLRFQPVVGAGTFGLSAGLKF